MARQIKSSNPPMEKVIDSAKLERLVENVESSKQVQSIPAVRRLVNFIRKELI